MNSNGPTFNAGTGIFKAPLFVGDLSGNIAREKDGKNLQTVNYTGLIPILIKEIKDLKEKVKTLESTFLMK